jgi:hypothetical protein
MKRSLRSSSDPRRLRTAALVWVLCCAGAGPAAADEVQVNTYTTAAQDFAAVAMDMDGDFVVVWESDGSGGSDDSSISIQGQRFASNGTPAGGQFQVNSYVAGPQRRPSVAMDSDGDFVVVWDSTLGSPDFNFGIHGQRYAADGNPLGDQFQVNTITTSSQISPLVAMEADGDFVVVWFSNCACGTEEVLPSVQGQRFASDGTFLGSEFKINTETMTKERFPSLAMDADGDFIVAWQSVDYNANTSTAQGRRYGSDGSAQDDQFLLNAPTAAGVLRPSIAMDSAGDFVAVWIYYMGSQDDNRVRGQRFASDGSQVGAEFQVNSYSGGYSNRPSVAMDSDGDFVVSWEQFVDGFATGTDTNRSLQARGFAADGSSLDNQIQANTYTTSSQEWSEVAVDADGDFAIVWHGFGDGSFLSVRMRTGTNLPGGFLSLAILFTDGFESGDLGAWTPP